MFLNKGLSTIHLRLGNAGTFVVLLGLCLFLSSRGRQQDHGASLIELDDSIVTGPSPEEDYLDRLSERYGLTNQTRWQAWRIQPSRQQHEAETPLTAVGLEFASQSHKIVDLRGPNPSDLRATKLMKLPARQGARTDETDASDFLFGVSTSYHGLADGNWAVLRAWARWLTHRASESNGGGLVVLLDRATDRQLQEVDDRFKAVGLDAYLLSTDEPMSMARRYHELVRIFKTYGATLAATGKRKTWFALVDDSVFFPGLTSLRQRLASYSPDHELYMRLPPDEQGPNGGAMLMTRRAVDRVPSLPCSELPSEMPARPKRWDVLLRECIEQRAGQDVVVFPTPVDRDDDDDDDDDESLTASQPLILRDGPQSFDVGMAHLVTDVCGEACFMQRFLFRDDWLLVNGVSISHHPSGLKRHGHPHHPHRHHHHRHPRRHIPGRHRLWRLLDSTSGSDGSVWQAYLKRGRDDDGEREAEGADGIDSVIVLIWGGSHG
ncbi:glycosyltransferase family 31 protein [Ophiocordyceps camponoti-floridani]|uniref:Glycosyltransferase family 31 protein n=1 Tax=Ophiocordyceps camponoti-floridani TaxID=2030778 RepID=A0A8H4VDE1_9HYPO|nr:glycosyltransferase family 31 protein [Ophiocordyceps camponoti-floridani]